MNRYPLWKYLIIAVALVIAAIYTLPNFYGEIPAVQVSSSRESIPINTALMGQIEGALKTHGILADGILLSHNSLKVRLHDTDTQLKARDVIEQALGEGPTHEAAADDRDLRHVAS